MYLYILIKDQQWWVTLLFLLMIVFCLAKGNQGPEGIHQDHEKRPQASPKCRQNHHQEEQEDQHHQVQAQNTKILAYFEGRRQEQG